ncbi:uncharacterized protein DUF547 [Panacagrimonas perspica]|uniref:Uncharacterized protein DUF547 n=1 Tax=Panacagrimonas perspica TaxID=381431 RepID=A0A4R7P6K1_9GAMM|nr:DUF547 domain-containing protein [Panacagrimonas perspica]TDU28670.1 uncharacterized protein DUF547 [Panacagrimonas perspica]THD04996.1 hypothetical protein B1810_03365 [Panacagrimonas perspica]
MQPTRRALLLGLALSPVLAIAAPPKAERWERWTRNNPAAPRVLNHTLWTQFLGRYVVTGADGVARVRYGAVSGEDRGYLRVYLDQLQRTEVSKLRPDEQLAYWINLYNAHTVKLVLERYPLASILSIAISPGLFAKGPWGANMLKVEDETLSLDDIEHRILRPLWHDPRTAYALCRAAIGSPNLASEAYTASNAGAMFDAAARAFVNTPRGVRFDEKGRLQVSSLYEWLKPDFGAKDADVIAHLRQYAAPALAEQLASVTRIGGDAFDWKLNDQIDDSQGGGELAPTLYGPAAPAAGE